MEQQIKEILGKIDALEKLINVIQQNLNSNIQSFLTCLGLIVATSVLAVVYYVKVTVDKKVERELIEIKEQMKRNLKEYIDKKPHIEYQIGTMAIFITNTNIEIPISKLKNSTLEFPNRLELFTTKNNKILKYDATLKTNNKNDELIIKLYNFDPNTDGYLKWILTEYL